MGTASKVGAICQNTKDFIRMVKNTGKEFTLGNIFYIFKILTIFEILSNKRADGSKYDGEWIDNKICGKGVYEW